MLLGSINKNPCHIFEGSLLFGMEYVVRVTQFRRAVTFTGLSHQKNVAHVPHAEGKHYSSLFSSLCLSFFCPFMLVPLSFILLSFTSLSIPYLFRRWYPVWSPPFLSLSIYPLYVFLFNMNWLFSLTLVPNQSWRAFSRQYVTSCINNHIPLLPYLFLSPSLSD